MNFDLNKFKNIVFSDVSPVYSWIWNSEINKQLIEEQMEEMLSQGIRAVYIIPEPEEFRPKSMITHMSPGYLTDEFFELVKYAVEYAKKKNISMWLYDEGGWPSGKACGRVVEKYPECRAKKLVETEYYPKKGSVLTKDNILALFDGNFKKLPLPYVANGGDKVFAYSVQYVDSDIPDLLDERAVNEFIRCTYDAYRSTLPEYFGKSVLAMFTDEPILCYPFYLSDTKKFERECGFCFEDNIPALFGHNISENSADFRVEYIDFCSKEFERKYMKRLQEWCRSNNIKFVGHMDGDDTPQSFAKQVGNALRHTRNMDIPGVDVILRQIFPGNKNNSFFPRLASSAAAQTSKKYSLTESFAVYGGGLSFDEMRYVCNYQFVRGINIINVMSVTSGKDRYLSGQCRPHFSAELPMSKFMNVFNGYISRMMYLCSLGKVDTKTALYMPMRDIWAGDNEVCEKYLELGKKLEEQQVYFDIIDDDFLEQCEVKNNSLCLGFAKYEKIYIPKVRHMSKKSLKTIEKFKENLGEVYETAFNVDRVVKCENKNIRAMKRVLGNAILYILFNESGNFLKCKIDFNETKKGYILDCVDGTVKEADSSDYVFDFCGGGAYAVLFTDKLLSCDKSSAAELRLITEIKDFDIKPVSRLKYECGRFVSSCDFCDISSKNFSGTVRYTAYFDFDSNCDAIIDLGKVYYAARIIINGADVGAVIMPPYRIDVDRNLLRKRNKIEIEVSNTPANALVSADYSAASDAQIGPYCKTTLEFEKESLKLGIESVKIFQKKRF